MKNKKTAAFLMSLLICASSAFAAAPAVFAAIDDDESVSIESPDSDEDDDEEEESEEKFWGNFAYTVTEENTVSISYYKGEDKEITIPEEIDGMQVCEIAGKAFVQNHWVEKITIPKTITYISTSNPFIAADMLREIIVDSENENYISEDGILYSKDKTELIAYPIGRDGSSFTVPEGVTKLGASAFACSKKLSDFKLPSSLKETNHHTFSMCYELESIDLSTTSLETIGIMDFYDCSKLKDVKFPKTLTKIDGAAFASCVSLENIELPDGLTSVGQNAFADTAMMKVVVPESVYEIGYCAFGYSKNLTPVSGFVIVGVSGSWAQRYASDYDSEYDYKNEFEFRTLEQEEEYKEFEKLGVVTEGNFAYAIIDGNASIVRYLGTEDNIVIPSVLGEAQVTSLYKSAFSGCTAVSITVPESITQIGEKAFAGCSNLVELNLKQNVESIGAEAFCDCISVEKITIGGACREIGESAFYGCLSLTEIAIGEGEGGDLSSKDGVLYNKDGSVLIAYPAGKADSKFTVPKGVREIRQFAFVLAVNLKEVTLTDVETLGACAFENCDSLSRVKLSKNLGSVGNYAFYGCTKLEGIRLYDNISEIGNMAFGFKYNENYETEIEEYVEAIENEDTDAKEPEEDAPIEGFKIYASKDNTLAADYCTHYGIELVTGTVSLFGLNIDNALFYGILGVLGAVILAFIGIITGKSIKKKKASGSSSDKKASAEETTSTEGDKT